MLKSCSGFGRWLIIKIEPVMILEVRKGCLEAIERALVYIEQANSLCDGVQCNKARQKIQSARNQIQLLKDNFTLIITKIIRLEGRCSEKECQAHTIQAKYRSRCEELLNTHKMLESRHQKTLKELNFIKFSNKSLRREVSTLAAQGQQYQAMKNILHTIQDLISQNTSNLQSKIHKAIGRVLLPESFTFQTPELNPEAEFISDLIAMKESQTPERLDFDFMSERKRGGSVGKESQCSEIEGLHSQTKKKKPTNFREQAQVVSNQKKKRGELAKLIEQQGRLSKIKERYLSTDIV